MRTIVLLAASLGLTLAVFLGNARYRGIPAVAWAEDDQKIGEKGEKVYQENCAACHGQKGDGKGPQADKLKTKPRDFTTGIYKFRSTPSGSLPLDDDLFRTISSSVRGTSMLAQLQLANEERRAVAQYLKTFSTRFKKQKPGQPISIPARPVENKELIARGETLYKDAGCASCHGANGTANGPSADGLKDSWGFPVRPADLTVKPFKSGSKPEDLFRTFSTGLDAHAVLRSRS